MIVAARRALPLQSDLFAVPISSESQQIQDGTLGLVTTYRPHQSHSRQEEDSTDDGHTPGVLAEGQSFVKNGHYTNGQTDGSHEGKDDAENLLALHLVTIWREDRARFAFAVCYLFCTCAPAPD